METFSYDKETGASYPSSFSCRLIDPVVRSPKGTGIVQTRPENPIAKWQFTLNFSFVHPSEWVYVHDFWYAHRGGALFYFQWPMGLYGIPSFGGVPLYDPTYIWDTAITTGFGEGPVKICYFDMDELGYVRKSGIENYWTLETSLIIMER